MSSANTDQKSLAARLESILSENSTCADCPAQRPLWGSYLRWPKKGMSDESRMDESSQQHNSNEEMMNIDIDGALGVVVCNDCAQHHHFELGKKRCLIKFLKYSHELTPRDLDILEYSGNALVNQYYESNLWGSFQKELKLEDVEAEAKRRGKFIKEKYKKCLYRDHMGLSKAVQQCLKMQSYQNSIEGHKAKASRRTSKMSSSNKDSHKNDDKIANAVNQIKRTKSGGSDYRRNNKDGPRRSSTTDALPKVPKNPMRKTASLDSENYAPAAAADPDVDREEVPTYNPTGKTYTNEFNLDVAQEKVEEKANLLKEFLEKGSDPKDHEFIAPKKESKKEGKQQQDSGEEEDEEEEDDKDAQAGWGIHCLKSQLQVVQTLTKTQVRSKPARERGVTVAANEARRASTMAVHMADLQESMHSVKSKLKRTGSLDSSGHPGDFGKKRDLKPKASESTESSSSGEATGKNKEPKKTKSLDTDSGHSLMGKKKDPHLPKREAKKTKSLGVDSGHAAATGKIKEPKKTKSLDTDSGHSLMGRKKDPHLENLQLKMLEVQSALQKTMGVAESLKKTAAMGDASAQKFSTRRRAPPQRGVLRRNSSLSDLDKLKKGGGNGSDGGGGSRDNSTKRGGRKKDTIALEARRKKQEEENAKSVSPKPVARSRSGSSSPSRRRMRRGSSCSDIPTNAASKLIEDTKKKMDRSNTSNTSSMNGSSNRSRGRSASVSVSPTRRATLRGGSVSRSVSVSTSPRRGPRRASTAPRDAISDISSNDEGVGHSAATRRKAHRGNMSDVSSNDESAALNTSTSRRKGKVKKSNSPKPDHSRRSSMSDMSGSHSSRGGDGSSRNANLADKLSKVKGTVKKTGPATVASMPALADRSGAKMKDRSKTRKPRGDRSRSRSSSGERSTGDKAGIARVNSLDSNGNTGARMKRRLNKPTFVLSDLPELKENPSTEAVGEVATTEAKSTNDSESAKVPKNKNRSKSPKRDTSNTQKSKESGLDVGGKLAALPDMKPKTRKDAKSVVSATSKASKSPKRGAKTTLKDATGSRSRSSSAEREMRRSRERSRSPTRRKGMPEMHKSMSGFNLTDDVDDDLKKHEATFGRTKTTGARFAANVKSRSKSRSRSPDKRFDFHKSLSGLDERSMYEIPDMKSLKGLDALGSRKGISRDAKSVATAPVTSGNTKTKESESKNKVRSRSPKAPVFSAVATLRGLQKPQVNDADSTATAPSKTPKSKSRSKSPQPSHGIIDAGRLEDEGSIDFSVTSSTKSKDKNKTKEKDSSGKQSKSKTRTKSPKRDAVKLNKVTSKIDPVMLNNLSETISQVRTLVGPSPAEKDAPAKSRVGTSKRARNNRRSVTIPETSEPDAEKLHGEMAERMKQFKTRNERVDGDVPSSGKALRRRSSFSGSISELTKSDESEIKGMLTETLKRQKSKDKNKQDSPETNKSQNRRRSSSLNDIKGLVFEDPAEKKAPEEKRYLRQHMNAMLDDSTGNHW